MVYAILGLPRAGKTTPLAACAKKALAGKRFLNLRSDYKLVCTLKIESREYMLIIRPKI